MSTLFMFNELVRLEYTAISFFHGKVYNIRDLSNKERTAEAGQMWASAKTHRHISNFYWYPLFILLRFIVYSAPFYGTGVSSWIFVHTNPFMSLNYFIILCTDPQKGKVMCLWLKGNCSWGSAIWQEVLSNSVFKIWMTSLYTILEVTINLLYCYSSVL